MALFFVWMDANFGCDTSDITQGTRVEDECTIRSAFFTAVKAKSLRRH